MGQIQEYVVGLHDDNVLYILHYIIQLTYIIFHVHIIDFLDLHFRFDVQRYREPHINDECRQILEQSGDIQT